MLWWLSFERRHCTLFKASKTTTLARVEHFGNTMIYMVNWKIPNNHQNVSPQSCSHCPFSQRLSSIQSVLICESHPTVSPGTSAVIFSFVIIHHYLSKLFISQKTQNVCKKKNTPIKMRIVEDWRQWQKSCIIKNSPISVPAVLCYQHSLILKDILCCSLFIVLNQNSCTRSKCYLEAHPRACR